jgi:hypothetical protein
MCTYSCGKRTSNNNFFFHGNELVTGVSVHEVNDCADLLVPRRCVRAGTWSAPNSCEVYNCADWLVPRKCVRVGAALGSISNW